MNTSTDFSENTNNTESTMDSSFQTKAPVESSNRKLHPMLSLVLTGVATLLIGFLLGTQYSARVSSPQPSSPDNNQVNNSPTPQAPQPSEEPGVYCTMDAKLCPDGSSVGRVPPDCEFDQCPEAELE